jgi:hypothetical protein
LLKTGKLNNSRRPESDFLNHNLARDWFNPGVIGDGLDRFRPGFAADLGLIETAERPSRMVADGPISSSFLQLERFQFVVTHLNFHLQL